MYIVTVYIETIVTFYIHSDGLHRDYSQFLCT